MKQMFVMAAAALSLAACNEQKTTESVTTNGDTLTTTTTMDPINNTMGTATYTVAEGDVLYRDGKVWVYRNNEYVVADNDVTLDGGIIVRKNGEVVKDGKVVQLEEEEKVSRTGKFFNKMGEGLEDAWDGTKKAVRKAGEAVGKAGEKVGDAVKDAVN